CVQCWIGLLESDALAIAHRVELGLGGASFTRPAWDRSTAPRRCLPDTEPWCVLCRRLDRIGNLRGIVVGVLIEFADSIGERARIQQRLRVVLVASLGAYNLVTAQLCNLSAECFVLRRQLRHPFGRVNVARPVVGVVAAESLLQTSDHVVCLLCSLFGCLACLVRLASLDPVRCGLVTCRREFRVVRL